MSGSRRRAASRCFRCHRRGGRDWIVRRAKLAYRGTGRGRGPTRNANCDYQPASARVEIAELVQDPVRLDLWRYALVIATRQLDFEASCSLLEPLIKTEPALASQVLAEAMREYEEPQQADNINLAPIDVARLLRKAHSSWLQALQPFSPLLAFSNYEGTTPLPMGVAVEGPTLYLAWRSRASGEQEDVELPPGVGMFSSAPGWGAMRMSRPVTEPAWPWRWALQDIADGVRPWIAQKRLPVDAGPLFEEAAWAEALALTGRGSLTPTPIPLAEIEERLSRIPPVAMLRDYRTTYDLRAIGRSFAALNAQGSTELAPP